MEKGVSSNGILVFAVCVLAVILVVLLLIPSDETTSTSQSTNEVQNVVLTQKSATLTVGNTYVITAVVSPSNATNKELTYISSNPSVASVDAFGNVKAIGKGTTTIMVTSNNGKKAEFTINVVNKSVPVTSIKLNKDDVTLTEGESLTLKLSVTPSNTTEHSYKWTSSNTSVATVDSNGKVKALKSGTTLITVKTSNNKIAICDVTVKAKVVVVAVSKVTFDITSKNAQVGESFNINATVTPSNAANKTLTWESSNTSVATVSSGKVTIKGVGTTIITATSNNGIKATASITGIAKPVSTLVLPESFNIPSGYIDAGKTYSSSTLKFKTIKQKDASNYYALIWVKDASKQLNNANNNYKGGSKSGILQQEVSSMGYQSKGLIGTNGGFAWNSRDNIPILATKGVLTKNTVYQTWHWNGNRHESLMYGVLSVDRNGNLIHRNVNSKFLLNPGSDQEKLSEEGYQDIENWLKNNGARNTWGVTSFQTSNWVSATGGADTRTMLCQVDKNNFVLSVGHHNITNNGKIMHDMFGCIAVINMDGGGSTGMYYKTPNSSINRIYSYKRPSESQERNIVDTLYFVEQ